MAPNINNPGGVKNDPNEIRDGVVSDSTRFPGGFIDQRVTESGAPVTPKGQFNLTNASTLDAANLEPTLDSPLGLFIRPDGSQIYVGDEPNLDVYEISLSTPFDITSLSIGSSFSIGSRVSLLKGLTLTSNGDRLHISDGGNNKLFQYDLSTDFDITTARFDTSFSFGSFVSSAHGALFDPTGSRLYAVGETSRNVVAHKVETLVGELP